MTTTIARAGVSSIVQNLNALAVNAATKVIKMVKKCPLHGIVKEENKIEPVKVIPPNQQQRSNDYRFVCNRSFCSNTKANDGNRYCKDHQKILIQSYSGWDNPLWITPRLVSVLALSAYLYQLSVNLKSIDSYHWTIALSVICGIAVTIALAGYQLRMYVDTLGY